LNTDPDSDPKRIRIQYGSGSNPDPGLNDQKLKKKITAEKKIEFLWIKNYNLPIPRPPLRTSNILKKPSALKRGHPTLQNMEFFNFFSIFMGIFCPPDPIESGFGSATLKIRQLKFKVPAERNQVKVRRTHQRLEAMPK
jgi:hypothetical protein